MNSIITGGKIITAPVFSHRAGGEMSFYKFDIEASKTAGLGKEDVITVMVSESFMDDPKTYVAVGDTIKIVGELGSYYNAKEKVCNRYIYAHKILLEDHMRLNRLYEIRLDAVIDRMSDEKVYLISKKGDKVTLAIWCDLTELPLKVVKRLTVGEKVTVIGKCNTVKRLAGDGAEAENVLEILATDIL